MKQRLKDIFKGPVVFYPLLLAAFPIVFLYAYNIHGTSASQMWLPLGISVAGALVLWAILSPIPGSLALMEVIHFLCNHSSRLTPARLSISFSKGTPISRR
jgi:hypothetical protein